MGSFPSRTNSNISNGDSRTNSSRETSRSVTPVLSTIGVPTIAIPLTISAPRAPSSRILVPSMLTSYTSLEKISGSSNSNEEDIYSRIWDKNNQLTPDFENLKTKKTTTQLKRYEKMTRDSKWPLKYYKSSDPSKEDSPQFNVKIDGEIHQCIHFATSEHIKEFLDHLRDVNLKIDNQVHQRMKIITEQEQSIMEKILEEKQTSEEALLQQTKLDQEEQDKRYQQLLQEYINELEAQKLEYLNKLYQHLKDQRQLILDESQTNITKVTQQARLAKTRILEDVLKQAAEQTDKITNDSKQFLNDTSIQYLGGEELTKISMSILSKFGTITEDQHCQNISQQDLNNFKNTTTTHIKRTTYIKPTTNQY